MNKEQFKALFSQLPKITTKSDLVEFFYNQPLRLKIEAYDFYRSRGLSDRAQIMQQLENDLLSIYYEFTDKYGFTKLALKKIRGLLCTK